MNRFLDPRQLDGPLPRRLYTRLSQSEPPDPEDGEPTDYFFDGVDAAWFDRRERRPLQYDDFMQSPLSIVQVRKNPSRLGGRVNETSDDDPGAWFEISLSEAPGDVLQFPNLFAAGIRRSLENFRRLPAGPAAVLNDSFSLDDVEDATEGEIEKALDRCPDGVDWAAVYDVGQGACNGFIVKDVPHLYYDFGGGVLGNTHTFPSALKDFCYSGDPTIVLSHWDWDHWSSGNRSVQSQKQRWIVPRQTLGAVHRVFAAQVNNNGMLLVWSSGLKQVDTNALRVEKCTGSGRNHSGLALVLKSPADPAETMLFTGDARYNTIPSGLSATHVSIVMPHHGADMRNRSTPVCPNRVYSRDVISCGAGNSFFHPRAQTLIDHRSNGWSDAGTPPPHLRRTDSRGAGGLGHVALFWRLTNRLPTVPCGETICTLAPRQD